MVNTYVRMIAFQYAVLRGAITAWREDEEGMTTLEVLVIAAGLIALATGAVFVIKNTAQSKVSGITNPPSAELTT
jgi:O-antigen ligase